MAVDPTPWFVGGGASHSAEVARLLAYVATSSAEGIVEPTSLRVAELATPGTSVRVYPGAALILSRYAGAAQQSYMLRNPTQTAIPVTATGSAGSRTDLVVARVLDPQYEGQAPADPDAFDYSRLEIIEGVPSGTSSAQELGLTYPAVALARLTIPASTGTITQSMITDLRSVAIPRVEDVWRPRALATPDVETLTATRTNGEWFPNNGGPQSIDIPSWATRAQIRADWLAIRYAAGNAYGEMWVEYGPGVGGLNGTQDRERSTQRFQFDTPAANNVSRANWVAVDDVYIPASYRGTTQMFIPKARYIGGVANSVMLDAKTGMSLQVRFLERADPSTT